MEQQKEYLGVRVDKAIVAQLKKLAEDEDRSLSNITNRVLGGLLNPPQVKGKTK